MRLAVDAPGTPCAAPRAGRSRRAAPRAAPRGRASPRSRSAQRHVVGRARAFQLVQEPQPPLRERQRRAPVGRAHRGRSAGRAAPSAGRAQRGQRRPPSAPRTAPRMRQLDAERRADPADQPGRQQRVPAQLEEVVVDADPARRPSTSREQPAQDLLRAGVPAADRPSAGRVAPGAGSALRSSLPFGGQRQARPAPRPPTAPCTPAAARRDARRSSRRRRRPVGRPRSATSRLSPGRSSPRHHRGLATPPGAPAARPRPRPARSGTRGSSPAHRPGPGTPAARRASTATRSPVRYIRSRRRRTGRPRTAPRSGPAAPDSRAPPRPATYSSPATPDRHRPQAAVQHVHPGVRDRPADRDGALSPPRAHRPTVARSSSRSARTCCAGARPGARRGRGRAGIPAKAPRHRSPADATTCTALRPARPQTSAATRVQLAA